MVHLLSARESRMWRPGQRRRNGGRRARGSAEWGVPAPEGRGRCAASSASAPRPVRTGAHRGGPGGSRRSCSEGEGRGGAKTEQEGEEEVAKPSARARRLSPKARASPREGPVPLSSGQRAARYSEHGGEGGGGGDGGGGGGKRRERKPTWERGSKGQVQIARLRPCAAQSAQS
ncbi:unnamed protein product [Prorocentrum cordatum]|uniref:Uncharacterized protein n=1 Tax=Prorocentrum cordatum TaxID=2364126 RepID=A0ABN9UUI0_9DINO|nr:unnamed protein product [Polarella glacialis]